MIWLFLFQLSLFHGLENFNQIFRCFVMRQIEMIDEQTAMIDE